MPVTTHSELGASKSDRWIACPGSIRESAGIESAPSEYAEEGTAAHALGERCLLDGTDAAAHIDQAVHRSAVDGSVIYVTEEMAEAVQVYLDFVRGRLAELRGATLQVEHKFDLSWLHPGMFGTNDSNILQPFGRLVVNDYKHGKGVSVRAFDNPQLKYYALGALGQKNLGAIEDVEINIIQPRTGGDAVDTWETTPEELYAWANDVLVPAAKRTAEADAPLNAGDHCRWCPALTKCPAVRQRALAAAKSAFATADKIPSRKEVALPPPALLSTEDLERIYEVSDLISGWATNAAAELKSRLENGESGKLTKLVAGRATRRWADDHVAAEQLAAHIDPYERKLCSPAQAEKKLKEAGVNGKDFTRGLVIESRGVSLASINDKRPAIAGTKDNKNPFIEAGESENK